MSIHMVSTLHSGQTVMGLLRHSPWVTLCCQSSHVTLRLGILCHNQSTKYSVDIHKSLGIAEHKEEGLLGDLHAYTGHTATSTLSVHQTHMIPEPRPRVNQANAHSTE